MKISEWNMALMFVGFLSFTPVNAGAFECEVSDSPVGITHLSIAETDLEGQIQAITRWRLDSEVRMPQETFRSSNGSLDDDRIYLYEGHFAAFGRNVLFLENARSEKARIGRYSICQPGAGVKNCSREGIRFEGDAGFAHCRVAGGGESTR